MQLNNPQILPQDKIMQQKIKAYQRKLQFIQADKRNMKQEIDDLTNALMINKQMMKIVMQKQQKQRNGHDKLSIQKLIGVINQLQCKIDKLKIEKRDFETDCLIKDQVLEQQKMFFRSLTREYQQKIKQLRELIMIKQSSVTMIQLKMRKDQTVQQRIQLKLFNQKDQLKNLIRNLEIENKKIKQQNKFVKEIYGNLQKQLIKLKVSLTSPMNYYRMKGKQPQQEFLYHNNYRLTDQDLDLHQILYTISQKSQIPKFNPNQKDISIRQLKLVFEKLKFNYGSLHQKYLNLFNQYSDLESDYNNLVEKEKVNQMKIYSLEIKNSILRSKVFKRNQHKVIDPSLPILDKQQTSCIFCLKRRIISL